MRDLRRERRLVWDMLLLECAVVFVAILLHYPKRIDYMLVQGVVFLLMLFVTRRLATATEDKCSDFKQGLVTILCSMYVYMIYSIASMSDRLLPACMFFMIVECTIYKDIQLNLVTVALNVLLSLITLGLSGVGMIWHAYRWSEFIFIMIVMVASSAFMLFMQTRDLFTERVAREDEKTLDDLLALVEMKCEDATAAAKAKSSFLTNMSHEIRTPINAVLGMNEMILREEADEEIRGYARNIQSAGTMLLSLVNDILDISKIESGKMEVVPEVYELNSMLYDILLVMQPRIEKKSLRLILDIDETIPNVLYGDEVRIRQIITNILTNAIKYTDEGSITLRVGMKNKDARTVVLLVSVVDTGTGIKESKEELFASFNRGHDLRTHHIEGTGLGLAITQQLLNLMGSTLEMESVYGEGSTFSFALTQKVIGDEPMGNLSDLYQKRLLQEKRYKESFVAPEAQVLVVDDNPMNRKVVCSLLKQTQVQIDTAVDGVDALKQCEQKQYHLIFMDHLMPNKDGIETLRQLRAEPSNKNASTPVVVLTANALAGMRQKYLEEGFDAFLAKPVQSQLLEETLLQFLPEELVLRTQLDELSGEAEVRRRQLLTDKLEELGLRELVLEDALQYSSGTVEDVLENISDYLGEAQDNHEQISMLAQKRDWKNLKILVHSLKSTSRVIGAVHISILAQAMEEAAAGEAGSYVDENIEELLEEYTQLCEKLKKLFDIPDITALLPRAEQKSMQREAYIYQAKQFLKGIEEYDVDFEQLKDFCNMYPKDEQLEDEREQLQSAVSDFDYERIAAKLTQIIDSLS